MILSESYVVRIDGNPNYHYMKETIKIINNSIFIVDTTTTGLSYHLLLNEYINEKKSEPLKDLLALILNNGIEVIKAVEKLEKEEDSWKEIIINAKTFDYEENMYVPVKGMTLSNY